MWSFYDLGNQWFHSKFYCDWRTNLGEKTRLINSEMNRFHSQKLIEATDGLLKGRLNSKRRQTILRQNNIYEILKKFESLTQTEKIASLQFHLLEIGTLSKKHLSPEYFDCLPPFLDETLFIFHFNFIFGSFSVLT